MVFGEHDSFGQAHVDGGTEFATYQRNGTTGLDYAMHRYYGFTLGRFMTPDPFGPSANGADPQTWNRYGYADNDPINKSDPSGLDPIPPIWVPGEESVLWIDLAFQRRPGRRRTPQDLGPPPELPPLVPPAVDEERRKELEKLKVCIERKIKEADQARESYYNEAGERVLRQGLFAAGRGVVSGAYFGAFATGPWSLGVGTIPGAVLGGLIGGAVGLASTALTGPVFEAIEREWYDRTVYGPAVERAPAECISQNLSGASLQLSVP